MLPAGSFASAGEAFDDRFGFGPDDNYFLPLTMSHALGIVTAPAMTIMAGAQITLADRFSPSQFWDQLDEAGANACILFPTHLNLLLETQDGAPAAGDNQLRLVITHAWNERFRQRFGAEFALVWGMTETGAMCTGSEPGVSAATAKASSARRWWASRSRSATSSAPRCRPGRAARSACTTRTTCSGT